MANSCQPTVCTSDGAGATQVNDKCTTAMFLRRNCTYTISRRIREYRIFVNILGRSRINSRVITRTDFHIKYSPILVYSSNLEVPRMYSAHNDEYRECSCLPFLAQRSRLFSENKRMCRSAFRKSYVFASFYTKINFVRWIAWLLHSGKEMVHAGLSVFRVTKL